MESIMAALLYPALVLLLVGFLAIRLGFFSGRGVGGCAWFIVGGSLALIAASWQVVKATPSYGDWFVATAYSALDLVQLLLAVIGLLLLTTGLALYADFWQTRREDMEVREGKLSILENLQHDSRQPYHLLELVGIALREILVHYPMGAGTVFLVNRNRRQFVLASSSGLTKEEIAYFEYYPLERNIVSQAVELGDPVLSAHFDFIDRQGRQVPSRFGSCLIVPLTSGMDKIGGLLLFSEEKDFFARVDIQYLTPVAQWLAEKIKSARLGRELAQASTARDQQETNFKRMIGRLGEASRAVNARDAAAEYCRSLVGLAASESVHLCGLRQGELLFHGGSEPPVMISESLEAALTDAIDRAKPLIINQESTEDDQAPKTVSSCLVYPVKSSGFADALVMFRLGQPFSTGNQNLEQIDALAQLAGPVLKSAELQSSSLSRRRGFETVLSLLTESQMPADLVAALDFFLKKMLVALPSGATGLALHENKRGQFEVVVAEGGDLAEAGELSLTRIAPDGTKRWSQSEATFVFGRSQVESHLAAYDDASRAGLRRFLGEQRGPEFLAYCPVCFGNSVAGLVLFGIPDLRVGDKGEWERLMTLATGLFSLRLAVGQKAMAPEASDSQKREVPGELINELNNHLSAILGAAQLAGREDKLPSEVGGQLYQIIRAAERAASLIRDDLVSSEAASTVAGSFSRPDLRSVIRDTLATAHLSGDLYMAGERPRDIRLNLEAVGELDFSSEAIKTLFQSILTRFALLTEEDDVISISTYAKDNYVYFDLSRHHRNFAAVDRVSEFGQYVLADTAFEHRPGDIYLRHLQETGSFYAVDASSTRPAYLSFKFPIRNSGGAPIIGGEQPLRLLAIDDQAVILDLITAMGQSLGYEVSTASSGEAGWRLIERQRFDVVLTDLALPGLSGLEVAGRIHRLYPEVPIILVTGWVEGLDAEEIRAAGISEVIVKPFRIEQLTDVVQSVVADRAKT